MNREAVSQRDQAERSSPDSLFAANSVRCGGSEAGLIGSLTEEAVRLHNQNRKKTVVSPNESHPNMNAWSQCMFDPLRDAGEASAARHRL
jgi:hypothetical protein